jgi:hypothetical protein
VSANKEAFGVITKDGRFLLTEYVDILGGSVHGLFKQNGKVYYYYPKSEGVPGNGAYISAGAYYLIEIVATVHTHNNCLNDGTSGLSYASGSESEADDQFGSIFSDIDNYVIGCNTLGKISSVGNGYYNIKSGTPTSNCNYFK